MTFWIIRLLYNIDNTLTLIYKAQTMKIFVVVFCVLYVFGRSISDLIKFIYCILERLTSNIRNKRQLLHINCLFSKIKLNIENF